MTPRRPRILQVVQGLELGGAERLQVTLARFHDRARIDLQICSCRSIGESSVVHDLREAGIPLSSLNGTHLHEPTALLRLVRLVRERRVDVLHAHLSTPTILAAAASAITSRPAVATLHAPSRNDESRSRANRCLERQALRRRMRLVIAVAPEVAGDAQHSLGLDPRRLALVPNAIDVSSFDGVDQERVRTCRAELLGERQGPLVVSVGTLAPRKGHQVLVEATTHLVTDFPDVRVAIVGRDGPNGACVRGLIDSLGLQSHIACIGERRDIPEILAAADLFVLPSLVEGMPLALLEAMAARTPVVAAGVDGVRSLVADHATGRLVAPGDARALGGVILGSLGSPERSRELAAAARSRVEASHDAPAWASRLADLYAECSLDAATLA